MADWQIAIFVTGLIIAAIGAFIAGTLIAMFMDRGRR